MNLDDLRNDIDDWREEGEENYASLLEKLLISYENLDKITFLELKTRHFTEFNEFQYPNCFDENIFD